MGFGLGIAPKLRRSMFHAQCVVDKVLGRPAILHVTHWKAGSQWIRRILEGCCRDKVMAPKANLEHVTATPLRAGLIYPTVYATRERLQQLTFPCPVRRFVVIRDLRDALVSLYFSWRYSHPLMPGIGQHRAELQTMSLEDGLCSLIQNGGAPMADIIRSWLGADDPLIRYEDLLCDDVAILTKVLIDHCQMPVQRARLAQVIRDCRFEKLSGGRQRGQEVVTAAKRKGVAGDWRNHFTERVKDIFKQHHGDLLIAAGYERDHDW